MKSAHSSRAGPGSSLGEDGAKYRQDDARRLDYVFTTQS